MAGFIFADFDGCMYGLVATKGKEAGTPIQKPWRVAYINSSLCTRLNKKCDGSHVHTPCAGQNTSITEGYTPKIVRIVHECFRDDVRRGNFVPAYTSAAVLMHDNPIYTAAVSRLNPALSIRAQRGASLPMAAASWTEILHDLEEAESANAE